MEFIERDKARKTAFRKILKAWLHDRDNSKNGIVYKIIKYAARRGNSRPLYIKSVSPKLKS